MTNNHTIQTPEEEEDFLVRQLLDARHTLETFKKESSARRFTQNRLEKELETIEQALTDYMQSNGVVSLECGHTSVTLGTSTSIEVPDVEACPSEYVRTKITKEPNKILIRELKPLGNWWNEKESTKLTVKGI